MGYLDFPTYLVAMEARLYFGCRWSFVIKLYMYELVKNAVFN